MTPADIYAMPVKQTERDLSVLVGCHYNHIPEAAQYHWDLDFSKNARAELRVVEWFNFDGRRFWLLGSVWFDDKPVMVIQNAGREGDDHRMRFVTDMKTYGEMIGYLCSLRKMGDLQSDHADTRWVKPDQDCGDLTEFYGDRLGCLERHRY